MKTETRNCQNCKQPFIIESEDFDFYKKISVPPPTFCPDCRFQRRLAYRNERTLYRRKCDLCGEMKVSNFAPDAEHPVYCPPCWWSDTWDAVTYGEDYDSKRPFFEQFIDLRKKVPQQGLAVGWGTMINSDFCHMAEDLKNCYLVTHANRSEDCFYSSALLRCKDSGELLSCQDCELCLEDVSSLKCQRTYFSLDCENSHDIAFSRNCVGCSNCFGCVNLRNKQYCIWNEQYSKEEYLKKLEELDIGSYKTLKENRSKARALWQKFPQKYIHGRHNANASGDYIYHSKNARSCYDVVYVEDSKYCQYLTTPTSAQCYDYTEWGDNTELAYESVNCGKGYVRSKFGQQSWSEVRDAEYTSFCIASSNLFGCVSLRQKEYCILNKQYDKETFKKLREQIIADMNARPYTDKKGRMYRYGEFLPIEASFWGYNETTANEYFPLTREQAEAEGYRWTDIDAKRGAYEPTVGSDELPDHIRDASESILNEIISCSSCRRPYRIIKQELDFYKAQGIALPRECPECRYRESFAQLNSFKLYHRNCDCAGPASDGETYKNFASHFHGMSRCPNEFETAFVPERKDVIYCEPCYQAETA